MAGMIKFQFFSSTSKGRKNTTVSSPKYSYPKYWDYHVQELNPMLNWVLMVWAWSSAQRSCDKTEKKTWRLLGFSVILHTEYENLSKSLVVKWGFPKKHSFFHCYSIFHMVVLPTLITLLFDMAWSANRTSSTSQQQHRVSRVSFPARDPHTFSRQYIDLLLIDHRSVIMWAAQEIGWCNNSRSITHFLLFYYFLYRRTWASHFY